MIAAMKTALKLPDSIDVEAPQTLRLVALAKSRQRKLASSNQVVVNGVKYSLHRDPRSKVWYVRKRTKGLNVCLNLGLSDLPLAKEKAREELAKVGTAAKRLKGGGATLKEVTDCYLAMPKRCSEHSAGENVNRLARVLDVAWGRTLENTKASELTGKLWEDYARVRQGGKLDLSTRRHENRGINSAIRMAVSIFHEGLHTGYERAGIGLNFEAIQKVQWLPEIPASLAVLEKDAEQAMYDALPALKALDRPMWRAVMIARYAGLRAKEIKFAAKSWLSRSPSGILQFSVQDRPEQGFWNKTGRTWVAPIISAELEEDLLACPDGLLVPVTGSRDWFFSHLCNDWLRKFIPLPNKGLHRLRALYLEHLKDATALAVKAELAGIEAARQAAGHTTSRTTTTHYLPQSTSPL